MDAPRGGPDREDPPTPNPDEQDPTPRVGEPQTTAPGGALAALGYDERLHALFAPLVSRDLTPGRIAREDKGGSWVLTAEGSELAVRAPQLGRNTEGPTDPAVGDWVGLRRGAGTGLDHALIEAILPRTSSFVRTDPGRAGTGQVVAANVDTVLLVHSLDRDFNARRLERELVLTWESGAVPVVVLNKSDLLPDTEARATVRAEAAAVALDTPIHFTSAATGEGLDDLTGYTAGNKTVALLGASGVGKSTLINRWLGEAAQATQEVREGDSKGRHTTVARELVPLPWGGVLVDTPGLRAVGIQDAEAGLAATFSDVEALAERCHFRDCRHEGEPGCAVGAAVESGELAPDRLESYHKLHKELEFEAAKQDARGRRAHDRRWIPIKKAAREYQKLRRR